jgi:hypothetical protein
VLAPPERERREREGKRDRLCARRGRERAEKRGRKGEMRRAGEWRKREK